MGEKRKQTVARKKQSVKMQKHILNYSIEHDRKKHLVKIMPCTKKQEIILKENEDVLVFIQSLLECVTRIKGRR